MNIAPLKILGQNFLISTNFFQNLCIHFDPGKKILEIGPGLGAVTDFFLDRNYSLVLCEKDKSLVHYLKNKYQNMIHDIIHEDFLKVPSKIWSEKKISYVIGNLPFNSTAPIISRIASEMFFIQRALFGVQYEVAQKLAVHRNNSLGIFLQSFGDFHLEKKISRNNFYPVPKVDSAWVSFKKRT